MELELLVTVLREAGSGDVYSSFTGSLLTRLEYLVMCR
jgi:hypothetical protein